MQARACVRACEHLNEWNRYRRTYLIHRFQFYTQDPVTGEFAIVEGGANTYSGDGGGGAAQPEASGLGTGPLLPHIAEYTFMYVECVD